MSVADQINRIKTNIADTYTAAQAKGATMPQTQNSDNLATCIQSITTGGGGGGDTQFGLTISDVLGTVDETGAVSRTTISNALDFSGITSFTNYALSGKFMYSMFSPKQDVEFPDLTSIGNYGMYYAFQNCTSITSVSFPALTSIGDYGMQYAFQNCSGITSASFPVLASIGQGAMNYAFQNCSGITSVSFPALTSIGDYGMQYAFQNCSGITSASFPVLASIGQGAMNYAFRNCEKLESISFPELTQVTSPFNNYTFNGCDALTEIHFRADMQATIEALSGYADKFGATNATIYFDL